MALHDHRDGPECQHHGTRGEEPDQQPGLYRQVVRPYCTMCHLAAPSGLNFSSYASFMAVKELIFIDVCKAHTMPHSELQFKNFWTKETGALNVPGLLAITVGHPSCS